MFELTPTTPLLTRDQQIVRAFEKLGLVGQECYKRRLGLVVEAIEEAARWSNNESPDEQHALMMLLVDAKTLTTAA